MVWLLVIDWSSCQPSVALYRASGNRSFCYFCARPAESHHPGSKVRDSCLTQLSFTHSFQPRSCPLLPSRWLLWCIWHAGVPLRFRDVALPIPIQSSRQSPRSSGVSLSPFAHGSPVLPAKSPLSHYPLRYSIFGLQTLLFYILGLHTLLFSHIGLQTFLFTHIGLQTLFFSIRSSPRRYYANSPRIW